MTVSEKLASGSKPYASIEIVPPMKGVSKEELLEAIRPFMEFRPPFINVTCHREEFEFVPSPDGSFTRHAVQRRVSETAVAAAVQAEFDTSVVPHIICGGADADRIESQLQDLKFLGINNILALRGDSLLGEKRFTPVSGGYTHAEELVRAVRRFDEANGTRFCIGVGAYPEKHFEAPNLEEDIAFLKRKVDAGADYIINQMFFDKEVFYRFRDLCDKAGIRVPIIPGLKPLSTIKQINTIPQAFSIDIPQRLVSEFKAHEGDGAACYCIGRNWCSAQCADLLREGVPAVHFYTMGRAGNVIDVLKENF